MTSVDSISVSQLLQRIGTPDAPAIVDICIDADFAEDPRLIPTAFRHPHTAIETLAPALAGRPVVVVCQKGRKLSQGAAAILRTLGIDAVNLEGGNIAWRDAGGPLIPADAIPPRTPAGHTRWVTRHRPKIDRIACPWLIRRFVDPAAQFLFVSPAEVLDVAARFGATPFDVEGVPFSHDGARCTFDTMLHTFGLETPPLLTLAAIVRGADTDRLDLTPQSAGLLAASLGLSQMYSDDLAQLQAGIGLYDAFYRWSRDAAGESHNWPSVAAKRAEPAASCRRCSKKPRACS